MIQPGDKVTYRTAKRLRARLAWVHEVRLHNGRPIAAKVRKRTRHHWLAAHDLTPVGQGPAHCYEYDI